MRMRMSDDVIMTLFRVLGLMGEGRMDGSEYRSSRKNRYYFNAVTCSVLC